MECLDVHIPPPPKKKKERKEKGSNQIRGGAGRFVRYQYFLVFFLKDSQSMYLISPFLTRFQYIDRRKIHSDLPSCLARESSSWHSCGEPPSLLS